MSKDKKRGGIRATLAARRVLCSCGERMTRQGFRCEWCRDKALKALEQSGQLTPKPVQKRRNAGGKWTTQS